MTTMEERIIPSLKPEAAWRDTKAAWCEAGFAQREAQVATFQRQIAPLKNQEVEIVPLKAQVARLKGQVARILPLKARIKAQVTLNAELEAQTGSLDTHLGSVMRGVHVPIVLAVLANSTYKKIITLPDDEFKPEQGTGAENLMSNGKEYRRLGLDSPDAENWLASNVCI
jgi:hypothetical protein